MARTDPCSGINHPSRVLFLHLPQHSKQSPDEEKQEQQRESCQAVTRHFATPTSVRYNFVLSYLFVGTIIIYLLFVIVYLTLEMLIVMYLMFYCLELLLFTYYL